jgi:hypothetical protein
VKQTFPRGLNRLREKSLFAGNVRQKHTAGAKAHRLFSAACGTIEVVPCYKASANRRFSGLFRSL